MMMEEYLNLFSVSIQVTILELNVQLLIDYCYEMRQRNVSGVQKTNVGGWHSDNIINETPHNTEFTKLLDHIEKSANIYHSSIGFKSTYCQKINDIWININSKDHSNEWHVHPMSAFSGAFYLTETTCPIVFRHPYTDITLYYWDTPYIEEFNEVNSGEMSIEPSPNKLIIFPAWLSHKVLPNKENKDRISFSFNTNFVEKKDEGQQDG